MASLGGRSKFLHTSADTLFKGEPMVTLMEASDDASEDLQGTYRHTRILFRFQSLVLQLYGKLYIPLPFHELK